MDILSRIKSEFLIFDGAMGTMIQQAGLPLGAAPEMLNLTHPKEITRIHRAYVEAGSHVVSTNTFQANALKLPVGVSVGEVVRAGIVCARNAGPEYVALDVGPIGQLLEPSGTLSFERAYELYSEIMLAGAGADLIIIETMSDLYEVKAAVLAARENTNLPVICTMTFQQDGRTFLGTDPRTMVFALAGLGVDALGVNCSLGPKELQTLVKEILRYSSLPVIVQANAGLPELRCGHAHYNIEPSEYAAEVLQMAEMGVSIIGGCCGTSPEYISEITRKLNGLAPVRRAVEPYTACTSAVNTVIFNGRTTMIGERINPTGKKRLKEALRAGDMDYLVREAISQTECGADVLDVNAGLPEIDEPAILTRAVKRIQSVVTCPLQIDSASPEALERAVRAYNGKPIINSVNGKRAVMDAVFPIAKKYGALVVALTLDENGIPETAEGRLEVARRIVETAEGYGIPRCELIIDCLTLTASAQQMQVIETVRAVALIKRELGLMTVLGVSNVSFGLPARELLNQSFLLAALGAGLDSAIVNPLTPRYQEAFAAFKVLSGEDTGAARYVHMMAQDGGAQVAQADPVADVPLRKLIMDGRAAEAKQAVRELLKAHSPIDIIDNHFVPALTDVGDRFERGELFLPQLLQSAQAVQAGFDVIESSAGGSAAKRERKGKIIIATVKGDIHDIGKNIVRMMLVNYGYDVIDLGKDVPVEAVVEAVRTGGVKLVGLSALMTTTVMSMKDTIAAIRDAGLECTIWVGGAVLTEDYAKLVGADIYAKDAMHSVRIANEFFAANRYHSGI